MKSKPTISVVIPTYKESKTIQKLIRHLEASTTTTRVAEIIIADSGDSNALVLAEKSKVVVIRAKKQRAAAMNAGANIAKGSILYFLHADTYPPKGWDQNVLDATGEDIVGGCFRLRFDDKHWFMRASGRMTRLSWGWLRFGDQSLFVQKDTFFKIGGFDESMSILEDLEIVSRIKQTGRFVVLPQTVTTSAIKFQKYGRYRLQAIYIYINLLYHAGASQDYLLKTYQTLLQRSTG